MTLADAGDEEDEELCKDEESGWRVEVLSSWRS